MKAHSARTSLLALAVAAAPILAASGVELAFAQAQTAPSTAPAPAPAAPAARPMTQAPATAPAATQAPNVAATAETESDIRASALVGANIHNNQNETVGEIEDIILDQSHKMKAVIVSVGGFLGIGSRYVAIAPEQITMTRDGTRSMKITMNTTREQMKAAPQFNYISGWRDRNADTTATSSTSRAVAPNPAGTASPATTTSAPAATGTTGSAPVPGSNSFTEAQARERAANSGFSDIGPMQKDERGVWRGQAKKDGRQVTVSVDYQGNVTQQ